MDRRKLYYYYFFASFKTTYLLHDTIGNNFSQYDGRNFNKILLLPKESIYVAVLILCHLKHIRSMTFLGFKFPASFCTDSEVQQAKSMIYMFINYGNILKPIAISGRKSRVSLFICVCICTYSINGFEILFFLKTCPNQFALWKDSGFLIIAGHKLFLRVNDKNFMATTFDCPVRPLNLTEVSVMTIEHEPVTHANYSQIQPKRYSYKGSRSLCIAKQISVLGRLRKVLTHLVRQRM